MKSLIVIALLATLAGLLWAVLALQNAKPPVAWTFDGTGYASFAAGSDYDDTKMSASFDVKTAKAIGTVLAYKSDDEAIRVYVLAGKMKFAVQINGTATSVTIDKVINDNEWHTVSVSKVGPTITLTVDGESQSATLTTDQPISKPNVVYVGGGVDSANAIIALTGCVRGLTFNGSSSRDFEMDYSKGGVTMGCTGTV